MASAESATEHPLAQAVVRYAREQEIPVRQALEAEVEKGYGLRAKTGGKEVLIGNWKLLENNKTKHLGALAETVDRIHSHGATVILAAVNGEAVLALGVADAIKPDAAKSLAALKQLGVRRLVMLTGDHASTAEVVAGQIGITEFHGELLPEDNLQAISIWPSVC